MLVEEQGQNTMADDDSDSDEARTLRTLQAAACTYRIAFGPRAGQKVLTVQGAMPRDADFKPPLCADIDGNSAAGQVVLKLKTPWRGSTTHPVMSPLEFMQRLAALVPRPRLHAVRFHGVRAALARRCWWCAASPNRVSARTDCCWPWAAQAEPAGATAPGA